MHRRSAVSTLAAAVAGLSFGEVPSVVATEPLTGEPFSINPGNLAESSGTVTCPICHQLADSLELTPAGLCLACADRNPGVRARPHSDPFWALSARQVRRLEREIWRLAAELDRMNDRLALLQRQEQAEGSDVFDRAMEAGRDEWQAMQRELHLLHLLRAASRQFGS